MKKFLAFLLIILVFPTFIFAKSQGYVSFIDMATNTTLNGSNRDYDYKNYKISLSNIELPYGGTQNIIISLNSKGFLGFGSTQLSRVNLSYSLKDVNTAFMGSHGSGKRFFAFGTYENALKDGSSGHGLHYASIIANKVEMISYE